MVYAESKPEKQYLPANIGIWPVCAGKECKSDKIQ